MIDFGTTPLGFFVSSDISAAASKPVRHHAPKRIDKAKDLRLISEKLKSLYKPLKAISSVFSFKK